MELFISYGDALHHLKKYEKAIEAFSAAAKLAEKDEEQLDRINVLIGRTLMAHGQKDLGFQFVAVILLFIYLLLFYYFLFYFDLLL